MTGQFSHNIDAKGRLFIPASLRKELGQTFHVTVGQDRCLSVYSDESWAAFMAKLKELSYNEVKKLRCPVRLRGGLRAGLSGPHPDPRQAAGIRGPDQGGRGGGQLRPRRDLERRALGRHRERGFLLRRAGAGHGGNGAVSYG